MLNCRSIPPQTWEYARQALVFYFSRRHGLSNAEDLAHETLAAVLDRDDYQFEREEDFLKVCYGFAWHILQSARRDTAKFPSISLESFVAVSSPERRGLKGAELKVFLNEVLRLGRDRLRDVDWQLIQQFVVLDEDRDANSDPANANNTRVKLHRARKKLARLAGWREG